MADIQQQARELVAEITAGGPRMMCMDDAVRLVATALRAAPGATQFAGWQIWDAASEAWESATEQLYWVVKRARPHEAREVFTPAPGTLATVKPPRGRRTKLREEEQCT
jgi:hypothetical protein